MKIKVIHQENYHSTAINETGNVIDMDSAEHPKGMSPMELLIAAIGGCSTIDVVHILQKQKLAPQNLTVEISAEKENMGTYSEYKKIHLVFSLDSGIELEKVKKAIELSLEKYCSVAKALEKTAVISWDLIIR